MTQSRTVKLRVPSADRIRRIERLTFTYKERLDQIIGKDTGIRRITNESKSKETIKDMLEVRVILGQLIERLANKESLGDLALSKLATQVLTTRDILTRIERTLREANKERYLDQTGLTESIDNLDLFDVGSEYPDLPWISLKFTVIPSSKGRIVINADEKPEDVVLLRYRTRGITVYTRGYVEDPNLLATDGFFLSDEHYRISAFLLRLRRDNQQYTVAPLVPFDDPQRPQARIEYPTNIHIHATFKRIGENLIVQGTDSARVVKLNNKSFQISTFDEERRLAENTPIPEEENRATFAIK